MNIEESVVEKIRARRKTGFDKYGKSMQRTDLSELDWLKHAQEEAMDLAVYLEKLIQIKNAPGWPPATPPDGIWPKSDPTNPDQSDDWKNK